MPRSRMAWKDRSHRSFYCQELMNESGSPLSSSLQRVDETASVPVDPVNSCLINTFDSDIVDGKVQQRLPIHKPSSETEINHDFGADQLIKPSGLSSDQFEQSSSVERVDRQPPPRHHLWSRSLRPLLRRAVSEATDNHSFESEDSKSLQKPHRNKHPKPFHRHIQRTFDSSILDMPIELIKPPSSQSIPTLPTISQRDEFDTIESVRADSSPHAPNREGLLLTSTIPRSKAWTSFGDSHVDKASSRVRPYKSKLLRRMHSTAMEFASRRQHNSITGSRARQSTKSTSMAPSSGLRKLSCDSIPLSEGQSRLPEVRLVGSDSQSTFANVPPGEGVPSDPSLLANATAVADGNFAEQAGELGKQSTSSYLKEQFLAFFQPSDNKLAMKLFGSKNALLKEKHRQAQQGKWIIHPCSSFRFYWDLIMLVLLIVNLIMLPVAISFFSEATPMEWNLFNIVTDTIFILDIIVKFRTGIVANDYADEIILNPREIACHYLKTWFITDFISSIPLDYIVTYFKNDSSSVGNFMSAGRTLRMIRLVKLLSMLRLLRLTRLVRYVSQWEEFLNIASKFMGILNLVLLMLLLGHWNACLQYFIPMINEFPPDSWVKRCKLDKADKFQQYTWALFKAMSHMLSIGYGRFPPISIGEAWITIVSMLSGATCYALFVGHAAALIQSFDTSKRLYREKFKQVEEYMAYRKLPRALRQRIANYYEHRYQGKMFDEAQILNEFSECLREQVINYNCRALVAAVPFFTYADQEFVSEVVTKLKFEVFQPGDLIIKEGTMGNKMYFIQEGIVDIITKDGEVATSLSDGSYFGEICLLTNARRVASVKAVVYSNLYSLDRESFLAVLEHYPLMRRTMESVAAERLSKIGRNPAIVSNREDLKEEISLVKEIVGSVAMPEEDFDDDDDDDEGDEHGENGKEDSSDNGSDPGSDYGDDRHHHNKSHHGDRNSLSDELEAHHEVHQTGLGQSQSYLSLKQFLKFGKHKRTSSHCSNIHVEVENENTTSNVSRPSLNDGKEVQRIDLDHLSPEWDQRTGRRSRRSRRSSSGKQKEKSSSPFSIKSFGKIFRSAITKRDSLVSMSHGYLPYDSGSEQRPSKRISYRCPDLESIQLEHEGLLAHKTTNQQGQKPGRESGDHSQSNELTPVAVQSNYMPSSKSDNND